MSLRRNKPRLYLGLYARPKYPDTYHYALLTCPKNTKHTSLNGHTTTITKFHVKNTIQVSINGELHQPWVSEFVSIPNLAQESLLLVLICIGKINRKRSFEKLEDVLRRVPVYQQHQPQQQQRHNDNASNKNNDSYRSDNEIVTSQEGNDADKKAENFNCVQWVRWAVEALRESQLVSGLPAWDDIQTQALSFVSREKAKGRWDVSWKGDTGIPICDLLSSARTETHERHSRFLRRGITRTG
jgi:hypothetical protein